MKTFGNKHKMYLIIFFALVYNLYLYHQEDTADCESRIPLATLTIAEQQNLKDTSNAETIKYLK